MTSGQKILKKRHNLKYKDPVFNSAWVSKFAHKIMRQGKQAIVTKFILSSFSDIKTNCKKNPSLVLLALMLRLRPIMSLALRRKGKINLDVPIPSAPRQQLLISLNWIVLAIRARHMSSLNKRIIKELLAGINHEKTITNNKREAFVERIHAAKLNKHYRWK